MEGYKFTLVISLILFLHLCILHLIRISRFQNLYSLSYLIIHHKMYVKANVHTNGAICRVEPTLRDLSLRQRSLSVGVGRIPLV